MHRQCTDKDVTLRRDRVFGCEDACVGEFRQRIPQCTIVDDMDAVVRLLFDEIRRRSDRRQPILAGAP